MSPTLVETATPWSGERRYCHASLLSGRMERLQIDRDELAQDDPLLFRELQGRCTLCPSQGQCARDLATDVEDIGWEKYCPNAGVLNTLGALQNCGWAAQHLKRPHST
jgi:hypothetical protein